MVFLVAWPLAVQRLKRATFSTTLGEGKNQEFSFCNFSLFFCRRAFSLSDLEPLLPFLKTGAGVVASLAATDGVESLFGGNSTK